MLLECPQNTFVLPIVVLGVESLDIGPWHVHHQVRQHLASLVYATVGVVSRKFLLTRLKESVIQREI
jgi:hypothetical protein